MTDQQIDPMKDALEHLEECEKKKQAWIKIHGYEEVVDPTDNQVVIRKFPDQTTSAGGIVMPGGKEEPVKRGQVIAVGPGKFDSVRGDVIPLRSKFKPGDFVIFGQFAGTNTIKLNDEILLVLRDDEITGHYRRQSADNS